MPKAPIKFPNSVGATSLYQLENGQTIKLYMIDAKVPLYNMFVGKVAFFASAEQVAKVIDRLEANPKTPFEKPSWKWLFDGGFDKSMDGRGAKGWVLADNF